MHCIAKTNETFYHIHFVLLCAVHKNFFISFLLLYKASNSFGAFSTERFYDDRGPKSGSGWSNQIAMDGEHQNKLRNISCQLRAIEFFP